MGTLSLYKSWNPGAQGCEKLDRRIPRKSDASWQVPSSKSISQRQGNYLLNDAKKSLLVAKQGFNVSSLSRSRAVISYGTPGQIRSKCIKGPRSAHHECTYTWPDTYVRKTTYTGDRSRSMYRTLQDGTKARIHRIDVHTEAQAPWTRSKVELQCDLARVKSTGYGGASIRW